MLSIYGSRVGQFSQADSRFIDDTLFPFFILTMQQYDVNLAAVVFSGCDQVRKVLIVRPFSIDKCLDHIDALLGSLLDDQSPYLHAQAPKCIGSELENRPNAVDRLMIVENLKVCFRCDSVGYSKLARRGWAVNYYQF